LRNYLPEFRKTLTNRRVAQFYQVEMPLLKIIDLAKNLDDPIQHHRLRC
jgi:hypothetical protein